LVHVPWCTSSKWCTDGGQMAAHGGNLVHKSGANAGRRGCLLHLLQTLHQASKWCTWWSMRWPKGGPKVAGRWPMVHHLAPTWGEFGARGPHAVLKSWCTWFLQMVHRLHRLVGRRGNGAQMPPKGTKGWGLCAHCGDHCGELNGAPGGGLLPLHQAAPGGPLLMVHRLLVGAVHSSSPWPMAVCKGEANGAQE